MLDALRGAFAYIVAALLPLAGLVLAVVRLAQGERYEALMLLAAALLGVCLYALALGA
jgi:hypothetical protein